MAICSRSRSAAPAYDGFRAVIKTVGTGLRGSRALTFEEARGAIAALLAGPGIGVGGIRSAALLAAATVAMSLIWGAATWAADWYIARARVSE